MPTHIFADTSFAFIIRHFHFFDIFIHIVIQTYPKMKSYEIKSYEQTPSTSSLHMSVHAVSVLFFIKEFCKCLKGWTLHFNPQISPHAFQFLIGYILRIFFCMLCSCAYIFSTPTTTFSYVFLQHFFLRFGPANSRLARSPKFRYYRYFDFLSDFQHLYSTPPKTHRSCDYSSLHLYRKGLLAGLSHAGPPFQGPEWRRIFRNDKDTQPSPRRPKRRVHFPPKQFST